MVHIGGYYHSASGADKLAGSYGCFGFIPPLQTYSLKEHAQKILADRKVHMNGTTNADYQNFVKKVVQVREKYRGTENFKVLIAVEKRTNIDTSKTVNNESEEVSP